MIDKSVFKCPTCGADQLWLEPFYATLPDTCSACGKPVRLKGKATAASFVVKDGRIRHVFWYEWGDRSSADFFEDLRSDLAAFDASVESEVETDLVYDIDPAKIESQGNGHFNAVVEHVHRHVRETRAEVRVTKAARVARLEPVAAELLSMMRGAAYPSHERLKFYRVDCVHPQDGATLRTKEERDAYGAEYDRRAAISKAWFEKLLGEPVNKEAPILDVAERWAELGCPVAAPCVW